MSEPGHLGILTPCFPVEMGWKVIQTVESEPDLKWFKWSVQEQINHFGLLNHVVPIYALPSKAGRLAKKLDPLICSMLLQKQS